MENEFDEHSITCMGEQKQRSELFNSLHAAQKKMGMVGKSKTNTYDNYNYANLADYYDSCKEYLHEQGIFVIESILDVRELDPRKGKTSIQYPCRVKLELILFHVSGASLRVVCFGDGQDRSDKAVYKAITGARKYAIAMACNLVTTDDPEKDDKNYREDSSPPKASSKPLTQSPPEEYI